MQILKLFILIFSLKRIIPSLIIYIWMSMPKSSVKTNYHLLPTIYRVQQIYDSQSTEWNPTHKYDITNKYIFCIPFTFDPHFIFQHISY